LLDRWNIDVALLTGSPSDIYGACGVPDPDWHNWAFDITDGRCLTDSAVRVKTYPVVVDGDDVVVEVTEDS